jgi:hypothetical protein
MELYCCAQPKISAAKLPINPIKMESPQRGLVMKSGASFKISTATAFQKNILALGIQHLFNRKLTT